MVQGIGTDELKAAMRSAAPPQLLDVRRAPVFEQSAGLIAGAVWRDPERIADWALLLDPTRPVVVYCVHGHQVSQGCAGMLAEMGLAAAFLEGGIEAWKTASGATAARDGADPAGGTA